MLVPLSPRRLAAAALIVAFVCASGAVVHDARTAAHAAPCTTPTTVVRDPVGDVLTHQPGSPPKRVRRMRETLRMIDVTRAAVQLDGRTICAAFTFARPPAGGDFQLAVTLRSAATPRCCATLVFARARGRFEIGFPVFTRSPAGDFTGRTTLRPVANAAARIRGATVLVTGTLPRPAVWYLGTRRMPRARDAAWSATTRSVGGPHAPFYGDWIPAYRATSEPVVRQHDGAVVVPGTRR
jgi:hypothetical protein